MTAQLKKEKYRLDYTQPDYTITEIDLTFDLKPELTTVTAISQVTRLNSDSSTLILDGEELTLRSLKIDQQDWRDYELTDNQLIIRSLPDSFTLTIVNEIHPDKNSALEGLYVSGEALCTQCEAEGFRHITYYLDRPDVLAKFTTKIIADKKAYPYLLSNGNRIEQGDLEQGRHYAVWQDPFPKPAYLFALVAGDFDVRKDHFITQSNRKVELEIYVDKGNFDRSAWAMESLKSAMKWDETRFSLEYDLDIFMIVAVDFFNMGAMENKGLNIFNSKFVLAKPETATDDDYLGIESVIGHEYFHNWTGNRVTCRDWFQLSLKEGLTVFRDQEFSADMGSRAVKRIEDARVMRTVQFAEDASPMAHPIRPDKVMEMNNFYTVTVYEKGAEVIRMIHTLLGESYFQAGMKLYFERFDGQAVTCDDFVQAMQDASGVDLTQFRRWYSQSGTPELTITDHYDEAKQLYHLTIKQHTPLTADQAEKLPLHIPVAIDLYRPEGSLYRLCINGQPQNDVLNLTQNEQTWVFEGIDAKPTPAFLKDFSAPVKLNYHYSDEALIFLMTVAKNAFNRYDAVQMLLAKYLRQFVVAYQNDQPFALPESVVEAFRAILTSTTLDKALKAQILTLPSENEMANLVDVVDPDAIHYVRHAMLTQLGDALFDDLLNSYQTERDEHYQNDHSAINRRALKNSALYLLAFSQEDRPAINELVKLQYQTSTNMTDTLAALNAATKGHLSCADELLSDFDEKWHKDSLVMDKWFNLQATRPDHNVLDLVKALMKHRSFSMTNPNRIRALIGAFVNANPFAFHQLSGEGYQFLTEILTRLNHQNPQIASRLIEPLIRFRRYDGERQALMKKQLETLLTLENLSTDLYEKITKALS